ncbi:DUF5713 family protein [Acinetobacter rudis]|uniref:DUF5713 family protein n=1 Tax=Acinetobacter rudis TaxID=632955 RepID=UPI00333F9DD8
MTIQNTVVLQHAFLEQMYNDAYFPNHLVDQVKDILLKLCGQIETEQPQDLDSLYALTHQATEKINDLQEAFDEENSEIETVARESIAEEFDFIAEAYNFKDADIEELIAPRDW